MKYGQHLLEYTDNFVRLKKKQPEVRENSLFKTVIVYCIFPFEDNFCKLLHYWFL